MAIFKPNRNFENELQAESDYQEGLAGATKPAKDAAQGIAKSEAYLSGDYHDGIKVKVVDGKVYLAAEDWKSNFIEYGTGEPAPTPVFAPLRRGVRAAGFDLRESGS